MNAFSSIAREVERLDAPSHLSRVFLGLNPFDAPEAATEPFEEQARMLIEPVVVHHGTEGGIATPQPDVKIAFLDGEIGRTSAAGQRQRKARAVESARLRNPKLPSRRESQLRTRGIKRVSAAGPPRTALGHVIQHRDAHSLGRTSYSGDTGHLSHRLQRLLSRQRAAWSPRIGI